MNRKSHWENIYGTKQWNEVSWYEAVPTVSLEFIGQLNIPKSAKIIDIGGGDSLLADHLLALGYTDITVLDISEKAIDKAKQRLGDLAEKVKWIIADVTGFTPVEQYDFWHDRAAFHFLTAESDIEKYINLVARATSAQAVVLIGTFSEKGPTKCSGVEIKQYSEHTLVARMSAFFTKIKCIYVDHTTPFNTTQNFVFCSFRKITV